MNSDENPRQEPGTSRVHSPLSSTFSLSAVIAVSAIIVLVIVGVLVVRKIVTSKISASVYADMHKLETTTLSLPRDWHQPSDLPPSDIVEFHQEFKKRMGQLRGRHSEFLFGSSAYNIGVSPSAADYPGILENYWTTGTLSEVESTSLTVLMADLQPILEETSAAVRIPGYTLEADSQLFPVSQLELQTFALLTAILASEQARGGNCTLSFETALLPLRLSQRPEQSYNFVHRTGAELAQIAAQAIYNVLGQCNDPVALEAGLRGLNELYGKAFPGEISFWSHQELVALRFAAAYGYPVDLTPQPHANFIRMSSELWRGEYLKWITEHFPPSDPKSFSARRLNIGFKAHLTSENTFTRWTDPEYMPHGRRRIYKLITGIDPALLQHAKRSSSARESVTDANVAKAALDLARLAIVDRLDSGADKSTVTGYITPPAIDPFTSASYTYSPAISRHYSAGPDVDDDTAAIKYDATNGTTSNGDVWLTGKW